MINCGPIIERLSTNQTSSVGFICGNLSSSIVLLKRNFVSVQSELQSPIFIGLGGTFEQATSAGNKHAASIEIEKSRLLD
jgi:hypothetical protein